MKKIHISIVLMLLLVLCVTMLTACKGNLSAPSGLTLDVDTQTLRWNFVKGASFYTIQISGQEQAITTKTNTVSLENLAAGDYEIRIKANGDGAVNQDSDWVVYHFTREEETGLRYELINNGTAYQLTGSGTASGVVVMEDVFRGKPVIAIADKALYNNTEITSFTVGKNVKTIGEKAFGKCESLIDVTIPEGVTTLERYAFQSCKSLMSISLPDTVTEISGYAFAWCSSITDVVLGRYVTLIDDYAFSDCTLLSNITYRGSESNMRASLPNTVEYIGEYAFADCKSLLEMDIGSVKTIGEGAFMGAEELRRVDLGENLETIDTSAFCNCYALASVEVPDSVQSIEEKVFLSCRALSEVKLGKGLKYIGKDAFVDTAILDRADKQLVIDGWLICYMDEESEKLTIPADVYGIASFAVYDVKNLIQADIKGVKYVNRGAFAYCQDLYRVIFDDALLELGDYAFYNCPYLLNADLGNSVTYIGHYAFQYCGKLANFRIPASVTFVGTRAFRNTPAYENVDITTGGVVYLDGWAIDYVSSAMSLLLGTDISAVVEGGTRGIASYAFSNKAIISISIADSVQYICKGAFYMCRSQYINIPASLQYVGDYAFYGCENTNFGEADFALVIPEGTTYIGRSAFYGCANIINATIPGSVQYIGPYAFYECSRLGALTQVVVYTGEVDEDGNAVVELIQVEGTLNLQNGIQTIGQRAFQNCTGLRAVEIPNSVTSLGEYAFYKCESLQSVSIGGGVAEIAPYTFYKCVALENLQLSEGLEHIGDYAFKGCEKLKTFDLQTVSSIGKYSFYGCEAMDALVLPDSLSEIGDYAFCGCAGVKTVVMSNSLDIIGKHAFYGMRNAALYCETGNAQVAWSEMFNSSHRPLFRNCVLSEEGGYVVSVVIGINTMTNPYATNGISAPVREGYTFAGWATEQGSQQVAYTMENMAEAPEGTVLYAIWNQ